MNKYIMGVFSVVLLMSNSLKAESLWEQAKNWVSGTKAEAKKNTAAAEKYTEEHWQDFVDELSAGWEQFKDSLSNGMERLKETAKTDETKAAEEAEELASKIRDQADFLEKSVKNGMNDVKNSGYAAHMKSFAEKAEAQVEDFSTDLKANTVEVAGKTHTVIKTAVADAQATIKNIKDYLNKEK